MPPTVCGGPRTRYTCVGAFQAPHPLWYSPGVMVTRSASAADSLLNDAVPGESLGELVSLSDLRLSRRLTTYRQKLDRVLGANKRAIGRLYVSGQLFTKVGARAGRDLLLAHEHLLRVVALLDRLANQGDVPAPRRSDEVEGIFNELDTLLDRTSELTDHTSELIDELDPEG